MFLYTCYSTSTSPGVSAMLKNFLNFWYTNPIMKDPAKGLLAKNGFLPMPAAWATAITKTFVTPTTTGLTTTASPATANLNLAPEDVGYPGINIETSTTTRHTVVSGHTLAITTKNYTQVENQCATSGSSPAGSFTGAGA